MPTLQPHSAELQALLDAVRADFERDDLRLILADWLDERDDPRGEMIRLSCGWAAEEHNSPQRDRLEFHLGLGEALAFGVARLAHGGWPPTRAAAVVR
jgi:uncharacterized protein (TIGR02996 family)